MQNLFLPYPCAIMATQDVHTQKEAPDGTNSVTVSPVGPLNILLGLTQQMIGNAYFVAGQFYNTIQNMTSVGLWSSSDTGVAIVNNGNGANLDNKNFGTGGGLITAVGLGNCTITFNCGAASCSITVSVTNATTL
jgi:hypothetical protein